MIKTPRVCSNGNGPTFIHTLSNSKDLISNYQDFVVLLIEYVVKVFV
jgi:hypothetical protein